MSGIKNREILRLLRNTIKEARLTQAEVAEKLKISPPFLSRQLNGHDPLSIDRAFEILRLPGLNQDSCKDISRLLKEEIDSLSSQEKSATIKERMIRRIAEIGHNSYLSFMLDFWTDLSEVEQMEVFKFFIGIIEKKQKEKQREDTDSQ
mgnify:CR=1 FL=1